MALFGLIGCLIWIFFKCIMDEAPSNREGLLVALGLLFFLVYMFGAPMVMSDALGIDSGLAFLLCVVLPMAAIIWAIFYFQRHPTEAMIAKEEERERQLRISNRIVSIFSGYGIKDVKVDGSVVNNIAFREALCSKFDMEGEKRPRISMKEMYDILCDCFSWRINLDADRLRNDMLYKMYGSDNQRGQLSTSTYSNQITGSTSIIAKLPLLADERMAWLSLKPFRELLSQSIQDNAFQDKVSLYSQMVTIYNNLLEPSAQKQKDLQNLRLLYKGLARFSESLGVEYSSEHYPKFVIVNRR